MPGLEISILKNIHDAEQAEWDTLVGDGSPFVEWGWLASLEESKCVEPSTGWQPQHLIVRDKGKLVAACPVYLKGHSMGEFVFDHSWAEAAQRVGINYYPKILVASPFSPATGARFLISPEAERLSVIKMLGEALRDLCERNSLSSVHVNFCLPEEAEVLSDIGYLKRLGIQYQWLNHSYGCFDDYLAHFRSKRRNQIKREIREMEKREIDIEVISGDQIPDDLFPVMFRLYQATVNNLYWGRQYLLPEFFDLLSKRFRHNLCFVIARQRGNIIAGTFNVKKNGVFYGRYWGAFRDERHMHFNVSYYAAIRHCIENGISRFEPGAGGDFKRLRGFDPQPTLSMHFLTDTRLREAVADYLVKERQHTDESIDWMWDASELKHAPGEKAFVYGSLSK